MDRDRPPVALDRRAFLAALPATVGGCSRVFGRETEAVSVLAAGSLANALEHGLRPRADHLVRAETHGSAEVARLVVEGTKDPDVVALADTALFESIIEADWFVEFATNALVLAYDSATDGGARLAAAGPDEWYRPLVEGAVRLGRTDPDLDPLGYRTLFALELATDHYGTAVDLRARLPAREQVYPETQLVSQFETGNVDAAFTYRNMAEQRGYEYVSLPAAIDLSDPAFADRYRRATYELPDGTVVRGDVIRYGATLRTDAPAPAAVFERLTAGQYLTDFGFEVPETYPRHRGDVPGRIRD
jgi:molybdate/tungstate transport system substrate-binding protein